MKIGDYNTLKINRMVDFGAYLDAGDDNEVLMPAKFLPEGAQPGDEVDCFVFTDSEDRLIATTERPFARVGEFAYMQVDQVNRVGAFLDWGLESKQLLVPFREQKLEMAPGGIYLVYVYLDDATKRVVASSKIDKFIGNVLPHYLPGDQVDVLPYMHTPLGYKCIVDNRHYGMIFASECIKPVELEQWRKAYVKQVRPDGKIDLTVNAPTRRRTDDLAAQILKILRDNDGFLPVTDKSSPAEIMQRFGCSKRDFKQAIGHLYKIRRIRLIGQGIILAE